MSLFYNGNSKKHINKTKTSYHKKNHSTTLFVPVAAILTGTLLPPFAAIVAHSAEEVLLNDILTETSGFENFETISVTYGDNSTITFFGRYGNPSDEKYGNISFLANEKELDSSHRASETSSEINEDIFSHFTDSTLYRSLRKMVKNAVFIEANEVVTSRTAQNKLVNMLNSTNIEIVSISPSTYYNDGTCSMDITTKYKIISHDRISEHDESSYAVSTVTFEAEQGEYTDAALYEKFLQGDFLDFSTRTIQDESELFFKENVSLPESTR